MDKRQRMSFSPGPSSSRTPTPLMRAGSSASSSSRLSKEEIDEILDSPYETNYTYSDSTAYKPHIGSHDYVHPRLCRRFPATVHHHQSSSPFSASTMSSSSPFWSYDPAARWTTGSSPSTTAGGRRVQWTWTQLFIYLTQLFVTMAYSGVQYASVRIYYAIRYLFTRAVWYTVKYTILWPILAPYYAAVSYYNKARFVWRTTHNVWTVISWTFAWLTGQSGRYTAVGETSRRTVVGEDGRTYQQYTATTTADGGVVSGVGLRTRGAMARMRREQTPTEHSAAVFAARKDNSSKSDVGKWLFYLFLVLLLLFAGYTLYGDRRIRLATKQQHAAEVEQIHGKPDQEQLLKLKPSDELHQTHLAQPGAPKTDTVMEQPQLLHLTPSLHPSSQEPQQQQQHVEKGERLDAGETVPLPLLIYNTTATYTFFEQLTKTGQSLWEVIVDTFVGTYELLKRIFFVIGIVSMPIKFARIFVSWVQTVISYVRLSFNWVIERIAELPFTFMSPLKEAAQFRFQNVPNRLVEFGHGIFKKGVELFTWLANSIYEHLLSLVHAVHWVVFQFSHTVGIAFDAIAHAGQRVVDVCFYTSDVIVTSVRWSFSKLLDGLIYAKNGVSASVNWIFSKIVDTLLLLWNTVAHFFNFIVEKTGSIYSTTKASVARFFGSTVEKVGNAFSWLRDNAANLFRSIGEKIVGTLLFLRTNVVYLVWATVEKVYTIISVLTRSIVHFFASVYYGCASVLLTVWHSVRFSPPVTKVEDLVKRRTPDEVVTDDALHLPPDDHPLVQHFRRILTITLAEERLALERRLHELAHHEQQQSLSAVQTQSMFDKNALTDTLRSELDVKIRVEKEELNKTVNHFEEQILSKIRELIDQMHSQNDNVEHELDAMRKSQQELKKSVEETGKPLLKKERITQQLREDGRTETIKESTVLMGDKKQQQQIGYQQFDERALLEKVRQMIREELRLFDADRTGIPDYALESSGGSVLSTRCTVQYNERSRIQKLFGIPLWYTGYSPRTVIQRKGYGSSAGECWAFYGGHGYLTIGLSDRINVTAVSYEHLPVELSPDGQLRSAPRDFLVWSYQELDNLETRLLLGNFTYDAQRGEPLQMFPLQHWDPHGTQIVELETLTNWGAPVTCLYRFRVHGDRQREIPEVSSDDPATANAFGADKKRWSDAAAKRKKIGGGG